MTEAVDLEQELIDLAAMCAHDPEKWVDLAYDWGEGELEKHSGPREWQRECLREIATALKNPVTRYQPIQIARASGHGIGKSAFIGMIANWGMSTHHDTRVVITANTDTQLRTKTAPEVSKWFRLALTSHWFKKPAMSIYSIDVEHEKNWRLDFTPWSENNTEAFAGLHNEGKRIILIFDEASAIADKVWEVAEGALTDEYTEIIWIVFGNPTRNTGRFRECFRKFRHRWLTKHIDSRDVEGTNKAKLQEMVDDYGEDSDIVKVRIRGMFPSASLKQFIPTHLVDAAKGKHLKINQYEFAPVIITCDPAWEGDDELVIAMRQGLYFKILEVIPKNDNDVLVANKIAAYEDKYQADAVNIDGGYGTGIISAGKTMGRNWFIVWFSGESPDPGYLNLRAYMWGKAKEWLAEGGAIPDDDVLYEDLIGPETVARLDGKIQLESKKDMKTRGLRSPNRADSLILSFARNVTKKKADFGGALNSKPKEHNPYEDF